MLTTADISSTNGDSRDIQGMEGLMKLGDILQRMPSRIAFTVLLSAAKSMDGKCHFSLMHVL